MVFVFDQFSILILFAFFIAFLPFTIIGLIKFFNFILNIFRIRSGKIHVWKMLPNDQVVKFWVKPIGSKIRFKTVNPIVGSEEHEMQVNLTRGWMWRDGNIPFILIDKNNQQVPWEANVVQNVPREVIDEMTDTAFASGLMLGLKGPLNYRNLVFMMMIVIVAVLAVAFINYYFWSNLHITTQTVQVVATNVTEKVV